MTTKTMPIPSPETARAKLAEATIEAYRLRAEYEHSPTFRSMYGVMALTYLNALAITLGAPEQDDIEIIHRAYNKRPGQQANALLHDVRQTSVALRAEYDAQRAERRLAYAREVASRQ